MSDAVEKLIQILQDDLLWHRDLAAVLENKLDAMRCYDLSRLDALAVSEQRLSQAISLNEKKRRDLAVRATAEFFPGDRSGEKQFATARELAGAMEKAAGVDTRGGLKETSKRLMTLSLMLREITEKVQRLNNVNSIALKKILGHFEQVFQIVAQSGRDIGLYGKGGKKNLLEQNRLVDAIA